MMEKDRSVVAVNARKTEIVRKAMAYLPKINTPIIPAFRRNSMFPVKHRQKFPSQMFHVKHQPRNMSMSESFSPS